MDQARRAVMKRREFITLLGGAAASSLLWPPNVCAQQQPNRVRLIGVSMSADRSTTRGRIARLTRGLLGFGWLDGHNIRIVQSSSAVGPDRLPAAASDLIALNPDL